MAEVSTLKITFSPFRLKVAAIACAMASPITPARMRGRIAGALAHWVVGSAKLSERAK